MKKKIVAGNWKMNLTIEEAHALTSEITAMAKEDLVNTKVIIAPPFLYIAALADLMRGHNVSIAAQNCAAFANGAYTGEVSAAMIKSAGAEHVIIGHSERRSYFKESNEDILKKVKLALESNLAPVFCCGETLNERNSGRHFHIIKEQLDETLFTLNEEDFKNIIIAYEPVWAIGTGVTASSSQAQEIHEYIRKLIAEKYNEQASRQAFILYGGSCNEKNAEELFSQPDIDGGLIGGASLKAGSFASIIKTAAAFS